MSAPALTFDVPPKRPRSGPDPLLGFLKTALGQPVILSMAQVDRIDSYRLRTLLVAQARWAADAVSFELSDAAPSFQQGLVRLGLTETHFVTKDPS